MPEVTAFPQSGDTVAGKYLIERLVGTGKTSLVFSARHRVTGKRFAIEWMLGHAEDTKHDALLQDDEHDEHEHDETVEPQPAAAVGGEQTAAGLVDRVDSVDTLNSVDRIDGADVVDDAIRDADELVSDAHELEGAEHRIIGHFRHPSVLEVYDIGETSGTLYTVMEWSDGESLEARIARNGAMSMSEACRLLIPCLRGMHEAHSAGIVHGDLKPSNMFICQPTQTTPEVVKVLDFDVVDPAARSGETERASLVRYLATKTKPYYRAPEQFGDTPIDHRADVYAFGAILYEMLAGQPPFAPLRHGNRDELTPTRLAALHARRDRLPLAVDAIVGRAMA